MIILKTTCEEYNAELNFLASAVPPSKVVQLYTLNSLQKIIKRSVSILFI